MFKGCTLKSFALILLFVLIASALALPVLAHPTETSRAGDSTPEPLTGAPEPVAATAVIDNDTGVMVAEGSLPELPGGIIAFVAYLALNAVSLVATLEKIPQYQALPPGWKFGITFALVVVVFPLGADLLTQFLGGLPEATLATINHYYGVIAKGWYTWGPTFFAYYGYKKLTALPVG